MSAIAERPLAGHGIPLHCRVAGPASGPLVVCLHGFPDAPHGFDPLLQALAGAGYRAVAPAMRGYAPSPVPPDGDCRIATLGRDALAIADALGARRLAIVGHDWGALAAHAAAALAPERVATIVACAVPHPRRMRAALLHPRQLRRSWYIGFFQLPRLPERVLARGGLIERLWRDWSPGVDWPDAVLARVRAALDGPERIRAALAYYRALPAQLLWPRHAAERRRLLAPTPVPAMLVCGARDGCIGAELFADVADCYPAGLHRWCADQAGHFMHYEQPRRFVQAVLAHLDASALHAAG